MFAPPHVAARPLKELASRLRLMVIADRGARPDHELVAKVEQALAAGAPAVQLRDKSGSPRDTLALARRLADLTRAHGALFLVNDRADIAQAAGADGVHVGQDDLPPLALRRAFGDAWIVGASASSPAEAIDALEAGADYVGCGTVFATGSKADAGEPIGTSGLEAVVRSVSIPVLGIGGITPARAPAVARAGAAGAAVISAVMDAPSPSDAVRALLAPWGPLHPPMGDETGPETEERRKRGEARLT